MNILIVDDEAKNLKLLDVLLSGNYNILKALDGLTALEVLKKNKVDLILLDIMMPGMNGFEVCTAIKKDEATKDIPVIMLTSLNDDDSQIKGLQFGAVDYITKPFKLEILEARIKTQLELKKSKDELKTLLDEMEHLVTELTDALANIKTLKDLLPICANCKKVRDDQGYWSQVDSYIMKHTDTKVSHSICPDCAKKLYPDLDLSKLENK